MTNDIASIPQALKDVIAAVQVRTDDLVPGGLIPTEPIHFTDCVGVDFILFDDNLRDERFRVVASEDGEVTLYAFDGFGVEYAIRFGFTPLTVVAESVVAAIRSVL